MSTIHELLDELRARIDALVAQGHREALDKVNDDGGRAMKEHVRKAAEAMGREPHTSTSLWLAECLDAAGLLRTGMEQRAMDACERVKREWDKHWSGKPPFANWCARDAYDVGCEIVVSRKPKERWVAMTYVFSSEFGLPLAPRWCVRDPLTLELHSTGTKAQCRAVAEALNKLEAR